jgi:hypothetical protein
MYAVSPLESLFPEERRCPRCGYYLHNERRESERRLQARRVNEPDAPGPPQQNGERRNGDRRERQRRSTTDLGASRASASGSTPGVRSA